MEAFIVRPFGKKEIIKKDKSTGELTTVTFDFDIVDNELIVPAIKTANLTGGTTGKIFEAGDIREDMFSLLLFADVVIADITIHNANVFYELGIRHALRDKKTILLKCPGFDETPFDILGYRYVNYNKDKPADALDNLVQAINETLRSDRKDSPVFNVLPWLKATNTEQFLIIPDDFRKEVDLYIRSKQTDRLALLTEEVRGFLWEVPALRIIGQGQFQLKALEGAKQTWTQIEKRNPHDRQANDRLSTIYSRLAEITTSGLNRLEYLALSDQAITQLLETDAVLEPSTNSEAYALRARNAKSRWMGVWADKPAGTERQITALVSPFLKQAYEDYERGFNEDLNHFYSGVNALGLLSVIVALADANPETWELEYESEAKAQQALQEYKDRHQQLGIVVMASLEATQKRLQRTQKEDPWLSISLADVNCLVLKHPERVGLLYRKALSDLRGFNLDSAQRQLLIYRQLGILVDNVDAALKQFPPLSTQVVVEKMNYLLFTGHMIDKKGRVDVAGNPNPRFPPEKETEFRQAIYDAVMREQKKVKGPLVGLAGGACGGDILFHEVCKELGISTQLLIALPRDQFLKESVQFAGPDWVDRFDALYGTLPTEILSETKELPNWLQKKENYSFWERNNLWMLHKALANGGQYMTLIALWDVKPGDAGGGTEHMVNQAKARGAKTVIIDVKKLL